MQRSIINYLLLTTMLVMVMSVAAEAVTKRQRGFSLKNRSQLELRVGVRDDANFDNEHYYDGVLSRYRSDDMLVSLGYNYWADERTALNLTVKVLASDFEEGINEIGVYSSHYSVVPIFLGFRQYLGQPGRFSPVRPYVTAGAGPVIGTERIELVGYEVLDETRTLAVAGAHVGGGIDFLVSRHFMFGINAGYNALTDFDEPIGGHINYSGSEFAVGFGFVF